MTKRFDTTAYSSLSAAIDSIEASLKCSKHTQAAGRIEISLPDNIAFQQSKSRELAQKGFGACLIRSYDLGGWNASIIVDMDNCNKANLSEREIIAVILHELGHILNEPELQVEPTFEFCFIHGIQFSQDTLDQVRDLNCLSMEIYADSYANKHGYGNELISTFHKQNKNFEQQISYCSVRIEKILSNEYFEGRIMVPKSPRRLITW